MMILDFYHSHVYIPRQSTAHVTTLTFVSITYISRYFLYKTSNPPARCEIHTNHGLTTNDISRAPSTPGLTITDYAS